MLGREERKKDNQMTQIEETTALECTDQSDVPQMSLVVSENPFLALLSSLEFKSTLASMISSIIGNQKSQSKALETGNPGTQVPHARSALPLLRNLGTSVPHTQMGRIP